LIARNVSRASSKIVPVPASPPTSDLGPRPLTRPAAWTPASGHPTDECFKFPIPILGTTSIPLLTSKISGRPILDKWSRLSRLASATYRGKATGDNALSAGGDNPANNRAIPVVCR
jgi:hypothetical protein